MACNRNLRTIGFNDYYLFTFMENKIQKDETKNYNTNIGNCNCYHFS